MSSMFGQTHAQLQHSHDFAPGARGGLLEGEQNPWELGTPPCTWISVRCGKSDGFPPDFWRETVSDRDK